MTASRITATLRRLLGLTITPPVRMSVNARNANRFRPMLEAFEDRTTPTAVIDVTSLGNITEGGNGGLMFMRSVDLSGPLTVNYSISGTAGSSDHSLGATGTVEFGDGEATAIVAVTANDDDLIEGSETLTATVTAGTGYVGGSAAPADVVIIDKVYGNTFDWNGVATVQVLVTYDAPGHTGEYLWSYHLTNDSFSAGIANFALPAEDSGMVDDLTNSLGWSGTVGTFLSNSDLVAWESGGPLLTIGNSADFSFTTAPLEVALTKGIISDAGLTSLPAGLLAVPTAAPVPGPPRAPFPAILVAVGGDNDDANAGFTSLREAVRWVNDQNLPAHQLQVRFSTGVSTVTLEDQLPVILSNIFINGVNRDITIQRNITKGDFRLIEGDTTAKIKLNGLMLLNGGGANFNGNGGAIRSRGDLTLERCMIKDSHALKGGGIYSSGTLIAQGCTIRDNVAEEHGGGIYATGSISFVNGVVYKNTAERAGGIFAGADTVNIQNSAIYLNKATSGNGGGLYLGSLVTQADITGCSISNNEASGLGGGVYIAGAPVSGPAVAVTLSGCTIYANAANKGGGVAVGIAGSTSLTLQGATVIWNNTADVSGGGIYFGAGTFTLGYGNAITENTAGTGAGLYLVTGTTWSGDPYGFIWNNYFDDVNTGAA